MPAQCRHCWFTRSSYPLAHGGGPYWICRRQWPRFSLYSDIAKGLVSTNRNDLIERFACLGENVDGHMFHWMRFRATRFPIKRFWLMGKDVTDDARQSGKFDGEGIGFVECGRCHWQADDNSSSLIECPWRQNKQGMNIAHLLAAAGIEVDPDDISSIRGPELIGRHYNTSTPRGGAAITSPPCWTGSNNSNFCANDSLGVPTHRTITPSS